MFRVSLNLHVLLVLSKIVSNWIGTPLVFRHLSNKHEVGEIKKKERKKVAFSRVYQANSEINE